MYTSKRSDIYLSDTTGGRPIMDLNDKKICFIICYNQEICLQECLLYLQQLHVPDGFSTDLLTIADAPSMTEGYQAAMEASDARYKIYMHQDVFIVYPYFLDSLIEIFQSSPQIGMAGMVGSPVFPSDHMMWSEKLTGNLYHRDMPPCDYHDYRYSLEHGLSYVDSIDGLLMATAYDIPWRTDLLHGWNFYDVSQSFEFRRRGHKIVVPEQHHPWCLHDDGQILNLWDYDRDRRICMEEYPLSLLRPGTH